MIQVVEQTHKQKVKMYMKLKKKKLAEMLASRDTFEPVVLKNLKEIRFPPETTDEYYYRWEYAGNNSTPSYTLTSS